jgi:trimethylamine--corrinoid protein Co-methyltransferase
VLSSIQCPVSPLILEAGSTDALIVFARAGVPVAPMSMVLMGGSSPVEMASTLVTANAENLASLCVSEGAAAGAPVIYSTSCGPIDMRSGSFATGSPESAILDAAGVGLARHYGLPCIVGGFGGDPDDIGFQGGAEKMGSGLLPMLAGADLIAGIGGLETDGAVSAEALVLDADLVDYTRKIIEGIRVDPDTLHLDMLSRVGPGGNFLRERHTLMNFRTALWSPRILLREGYLEGTTPEGRIRERAKARAREILATHVPPPLDKDVRKAVWNMAKRPID